MPFAEVAHAPDDAPAYDRSRAGWGGTREHGERVQTCPKTSQLSWSLMRLETRPAPPSDSAHTEEAQNATAR